MNTFVKIAWRNIWRHRRRSCVVVLSIAIGIFVMIFSAGFMNGMNAQMVENTINTSLGHIAIQDKGFQDNMKLARNFYPKESIIALIEAGTRLKSYAPRVKVQGMVQSSEASKNVMIVGIEPALEKQVSKIYNYTSQEDGSSFLSGSDENRILISRSLARKLDLVVGDRISVLVQNSDNQIAGEGFRVKGFFTTPSESFDKFVVYVGLAKLQHLTGIGDNISTITVRLADKRWAEPEKQRLLKSLAGEELEVLSWKDMAPNLLKAIKLFDSMMIIFYMIIFTTVIFTIVNTLIMAIMERFHEIGVMKSLGTRPSWISFMVIFEAINLGLVGLFIGTVSGLVLVFALSIYGMDFSFYLETMRSWGSGSVIYPVVTVKDIQLGRVPSDFITPIS